VRLKWFRAATLREEMSMGHTPERAVEYFVGAYPTCGECGDSNVVRDAWASWSLLTRDWSLKTVFDAFKSHFP
jgi:hypothetical protein